MRNWEWLENKKKEYEEQGKVSKYYSEYECEIIGEEDQLFKEEYLQYWNGYVKTEGENNYLYITHLHKKELSEPLIKPVNIFIGIDPASSTKQSADYSVTMPIAYDIDKNIYVLPYFRKRVTPTAHGEQIIEMIKQLNPTKAHVETVGYQEMMRQYLRMRMEEEGIWVSGLETKFNPRTEKSARLDTLHPFFYNKKVYFQESMQDFIDELLYYPRGKHEDLIDGFFYATRSLRTPEHTVQNKEEDELRYFLRYKKPQGKWMMA
jgi:predicted phage terminase large subunit-like protein